MRIVVTYLYPPIPCRNFDYMAYDDDTYDGDPSQIVGYGATAELAEQDLRNLMEEAI